MMQFPEYSPAADWKRAVKEYIHFVGEAEQEDHIDEKILSRSSGLRQPMKDLGQACIQLHTGAIEIPGPNTLLARAHEAIRALPADHAPNKVDATRIALMGQVCRLLASRHTHDAIETNRKLMHLETVRMLSDSLGYYKEASELTREGDLSAEGRAQQMSGLITELTALSTINRLVHPRMLALPALAHHAQSRQPQSNYNISVTMFSEDYSSADTKKVRVRLGCINMCDEPSEHVPPIAERQKSYNSDILLISGHCDLDVDIHNDKTCSFPLAQALIAEVGETMTRDDWLSLNDVSAWMLKQALVTPARRGTWRA